MTDDATQASQPAALPFWKSPMFLSVMIAFLTKLIVAAPIFSEWIGLSTVTLSSYASGVILLIGGAADWVAMQKRANFKIQPLTSTQAKADVISANNTPVMEVKK